MAFSTESQIVMKCCMSRMKAKNAPPTLVYLHPRYCNGVVNATNEVFVK